VSAPVGRETAGDFFCHRSRLPVTLSGVLPFVPSEIWAIFAAHRIFLSGMQPA
jgi:hypothetical protein